MTTISTAEARHQFAELINQSAFGKERIILTRRGKKLCALVPIEVLEQLETLERSKIEEREEAFRRADAFFGQLTPTLPTDYRFDRSEANER